MKKKLKIAVVVIVGIATLLTILPYFFKDKIKESVLAAINDEINGELTIGDVSLSLLSSFPDLTMKIDDIILTKANDKDTTTLFSCKVFYVDLPINNLWNYKRGVSVKSIHIAAPNVNIKIDSLGRANYDDLLVASEESSSGGKDKTTSDLQLKLKEYKITDASFKYRDETSKTTFEINHLNHQGRGDFSEAQFELNTFTEGVALLSYENNIYLNALPFSWKANLMVDSRKDKITFLDNAFLLQNLEIVFKGTVVAKEKFQEFDINFYTPSTSFKNALNLLPPEYLKSVKGIDAKGDFSMVGKINGIMDETKLPTYNIDVKSKNGYVKSADLPKAIEKINLDANINNITGITEDTQMQVRHFSFVIDNDPVSGSVNAQNLTTNPVIRSKVKGRINIANLVSNFTLDDVQLEKGSLDLDIEALIKPKDLKKEVYTTSDIRGSLQLEDLVYRSSNWPDAWHIDNAAMQFSKNRINIAGLKAKMAHSDIDAKGNVNNVFEFYFNKKPLIGSFQLTSNHFEINDFYVASETASETAAAETTKDTLALKIPNNLNFKIKATADEVVYNSYKLKHFKSDLSIEDQTVFLKNMYSDFLGGQLQLNGDVSTKNDEPKVHLKMDLNAMKFKESFSQISFLNALSPVGNILGDFDFDFEFNGSLTPDGKLNLNTLSGSGNALIHSGAVDVSNSKALQLLASQLKVGDLRKIQFREFPINFGFENGQVNFKPAQFKVKDIPIQFEGGHRLDGLMDYAVKISLPVKYLGSGVASFMLKEGISAVPISVIFGGMLKAPLVSTDIKTAVKGLKNQLIEKQKDKIKDAVTNEFEKMLKGNDKKKESIEEMGKRIFEGLFTPKKRDTTRAKN